MENTTKSSGSKNKDNQAKSGKFGRDLAKYGLNTETSKGAIDFIQKDLDEQKRQSEHSRIVHESVLLSADEFATKTEEHHSGGAYAMRTVKETRKKPKVDEKKSTQDKGWTRGTRDLNYGQRHKDNINTIEETLAEIAREDDNRRQVGQLLSDVEKRVESIQESRSRTMREYRQYKEGQRRGEIGELARSKELEKSSDESDTLSLEEHAKDQDRLYHMIKERKLQKTSAERRDHLRKQLAAKPKTQTSPTIDTSNMSYESKVAAMRAKDAEQSLSIFGESDEEKKAAGVKVEATDSDDYDEKALIEEEKRKKIERAAGRRIEQNPAKWEGTGLESLVEMENISISVPKKDKKGDKYHQQFQQSQRQYQDPVEKRKQKNESLFPKTSQKEDGGKNYMNLDGQVMIDSNFNHMRLDGRTSNIDEPMRASIQHSFQHNQLLKRQTDSMRDVKNKLISASKFFILKEAQSLSCHHSQNKERIESEQQNDQGVKIFDRNQQEVPNYKQRSQNLSTFSQQRQAAAAEIPLVKDWFKKLSTQERVHCLTTIDGRIANEVKKMFSTLRNQKNDDSGKFQMKVNKSHMSMKMTVTMIGQQKQPTSGGANKPAANWVIMACNSKAYQSLPEVKVNELALLKMIKLTDTFSLHDTVTVSEDLVSNPDYFWSLATHIAGSNYAIEPQRVEWLQDEFEFESFAPLWFGMSEPNSLATWLLYFLERALWVQYNNHVYAKYVDTKDAQSNPMFLRPESRHICLREEIKPFWRALCENPAQRQEANLAEQLKTKALILFGVVAAPDQTTKDDQKKKVDVFSGGLALHEASHDNKVGDQQPLIDKIAAYAKSLDEALEKNKPVPFGMCVDSLTICSLMHNDEAGNLTILAQRYNLFARFINAPQSNTENSEQQRMAKEWTNVVEMRLDRVFAEIIREYMATKLSLGFTSKNKKLLKKKQKKQLKKELEKEKQRELEAAQGKQEIAVESGDKIIVKSDQAIDLLIGTNEKDDQHEQKQEIVETIMPIERTFSQQTAMSEKEKRDQVNISKFDQSEQRQTDTSNNYFLWRDSNPESSQQSSTIKTGSTREESQLQNKVHESTRLDQAAINAMSNEEFMARRQQNVEKTEIEEKLNEGNAKFNRQDWQRKEEKKKLEKQENKGYSQMVNELIDDDDDEGARRHLHTRDSNFKMIDVRVKQGKLHAHKEHLSNDSAAEEKKARDGSSSSASDSSDQDLLPDLFQKFEPQPHDNDSSDYGADAVDEDELDAELGEEDEMIADDDSSAALSKPQSSQVDNSPKKQTRFQDDKEKKRLKKKTPAIFSSKKSIKSAHPKMKQHQHLKKENPEASNPPINFYAVNETIDSNVVEKQDKVAKKINNKRQKATILPKLTPIFELLTVSSSEHVQTYEEPTTAAAKKKKKKSKKEKPKEAVVELEKKEEEEVKQIEIIKPQIEIIRPAKQPAPAAGKKGKTQQQQAVQQQAKPAAAAKKKKNNAADAMNQFMKSLHSSAATPAATKPANKEPQSKESQPQKQEESIVKKKEDKKSAAATAQAQPASSQTANGKFQKKPLVHQSNPEQRLSNVEEAQILGSGNYRYEVKGKKADEDVREEKKAGQQATKKGKDARKAAEKNLKDQMEKKIMNEKTDVASEEIKPVFKEKKVKEAPTTSGTAFAELKTAIDEDRKSVGKDQSIKSQKLSKKLDLPTVETSLATGGKPEEVNSAASKSSKKPKKRKAAKKRSEKSKKKTAFQQTYIDPNTGQSVVMDLSLMMQGASNTPQMGQAKTTAAGNDMYAAMNATAQPQFPPSLDMQQQAMQLSQMQMMHQQPNAPFLGFQQPAIPNMPLNNPLLAQMPMQGSKQQPAGQTNIQQLLYNLSQSGLIQIAADHYKRQQQEQMAANQQMMEDTEPCAEEDPDRYDAFYDMLEEEMRAKVKYIEEMRESVHKEREGLISLITLTVKETFASRSGNSYVGIKTFGSSATDLAIETSDVDLVVIGMDVGNHSASREHKTRKDQLIKSMQKLYDCLLPLRDKGQVQSIQLIATANVPIIKLVADLEVINQIQMEKALDKAKLAKLEERRKVKKAKGSKDDDEEESKIVDIDFWQLGIEAKQIDPKMRFLKVDISIDEQGHQQQQLGGKPGPGVTRSHSGIETIYHIKELCRQRKDLRPIVMVIKKILDETYLSMPYHGGISSLSLVLMVSAYLKRWDPEQQLSLSTNLIGFFHFYGTGFKPEQHYLDGDKIEAAVSHQQRPFREAALTIIDPMDRNNNVSHSSFNIHEIQIAFVKAFQIINRACLQFQRCGPIESMKFIEIDEIQRECQPKRVLEALIDRINQEYYQPSGHYGNDEEH